MIKVKMTKNVTIISLLTLFLITGTVLTSCGGDSDDITEEVAEMGESTDASDMQETDGNGEGNSDGNSGDGGDGNSDGGTDGNNDGNTAMGALIEKKDIRLHEHHTNEVSEVGGKSGYDLVAHQHIAIFGKAPDYNGLTSEERMQVDIHEDMDVNEASTMSLNFGFTSGVDSFGDVVGNDATLFMPAPSGFNYDALIDMGEIASAFDETLAVKRVKPVEINAVYLVKLRGEENYVAMKITDAVISGRNAIDEVFFDFDYKHAEN